MTQREELNSGARKLSWLLGLEKETLADMAHQQSKIIEKLQKDAKAQATPKWISVSDRLPCNEQPVDIYVTVVCGYNNGDRIRLVNCFYNESLNRFWYWNDRHTRRVYFSGMDVTHWMLIPTEPEIK